MFTGVDSSRTMNTEFLKQLEVIRDALVDYADDWAELWQIIHAIDAVLEEYRGN